MNAPTVTEGMVTMPKDEFEELLERVAERGARAALSDVGLDGENAANDIRELRGLLEAFNTATYALPGHESTMGKLEAYLRQPHHELSFTRVLQAPVAKVWSAWTVREQLMPWFCPKPWQVTACEIDLRPGGAFRTLMRGPNGESHDLMSCYLVVEPERRLVWTNALQPGYAPATKPWCTCAVELQAVGENETRLTARVMHADSATCEDHAKMGFPHGWHVALDQMVALLVQ